MSTTTSYDNVTDVSQTGSYNRWSDIGTLDDDTSGAAYVESSGTFSQMATLYLKIPEFMASITPGSEFVSLSVRFKAYVSTTYAGDYFRFRCYQNNSQVYNLDVDSTSTTTITVSGNAAFWGFSGSVQDIIDDLTDGSIDWRFEGQAPTGSFQRRDVKNFAVQLTYSEPDTKRVSLIQTIP